MMSCSTRDFYWSKTTRMGTCPTCGSDVLKIRQHKKCDEGMYEDGDLVECQCCSSEGVVELHYGSELPPKEPLAIVKWDEQEVPHG